MKKNYFRLNNFLNYKSQVKLTLLILVDIFSILLALLSSYFFSSSIFLFRLSINYLWVLFFITTFGITIYVITGQYKGLTRYIRSKEIYILSCRNLLVIISLFLTGNLFNLYLPSPKTLCLLCIFLTISIGINRFLIRDLLNLFRKRKDINLPKVYIYGAGSAGAQLAKSLILSRTHNIIGFIDDNKDLWGRTIIDIPINSIEILSKQNTFDHILLAIPSLNRNERRKILKKLQIHKKSVFEIPSLEELSLGKAVINNLRPIAIEDLLGREPFKINFDYLHNEFNNKNILITGAGGSIGSELSRQLMILKPKKLILLDISEENLYKINQELVQLNKKSINLLPILGDNTNLNLLNKIFSENKINYVFHAAAYKHVPIVEFNPLQGIFNNVISTKNVCQCSEKHNIDKLVLISTDKAVRPTNIMGASKRLAELIVQAYDYEAKRKRTKTNDKTTFFSMVRFGNVLGSSGSVVPLFQKQISNGGPITITHKDIIRYFMTIPEAAHLVLNTIILAKGGDVFLLDMGDPVKIYDLAERMIKLSGLTIKDPKNPNGDIEIVTSGLRPGEKLFEELLIDAKAEKTNHQLIFKAKEKIIEPEKLFNLINELECNLEKMDIDSSLKILQNLVPEWSKN